MFGMFGKKPAAPAHDQPGKHVRPMVAADVRAAIKIIEQHDEDDAEDAAESFRSSLEDVFVAVDDGVVVGVTGAVPDPDADRVAWLSWTYVDQGAQRQGVGRYLVGGLFDKLKLDGVRKVFISTGDWVENGEDIYAGAKAFYEAMGARLELVQPGYYSSNEARMVYSIELQDHTTVPEVADAGDLIFDGLHPAPELEDAVNLTWCEYDPKTDDVDAKSQLECLIAEAQSGGARFVLAAVPSDLAVGAAQGLTAMEFEELGRLTDYYEPGIAQHHFVRYFRK